MDKNKAKRITEIGLSIGKCCHTCQHFSGPNLRGFGTCGEFTYFHLKHQEERQLSVHETHFCDDDHYVCDEIDTGPRAFIDLANQVAKECGCHDPQHRCQCWNDE